MKWLAFLPAARRRSANPAQQAAPPADPTQASTENKSAAVTQPAPSPPQPIDLMLDRCRQAEQREHWPAAETLWRSALLLDETLAVAHTGLATALRRQGRLAEAEAVLLNALTQLPPEPDHFLAYAELADTRRDWAAAEQRWQAMRQHFPHVWYSYTGAAAAMRELGRPNEAVALLSDAAARFTWEPAFPQELGRLAASRKDWPAAEQHWRAVLTFDARPWWIYTELATALEHQGKLAEAEAVLLDAQAKDPTEITLFTFHARLANERQDHQQAEHRWRIVREGFPDRMEGYINQAEALRHLRRFDASKAVLLQAAARFPSEGAVQQALARRAEALSDWTAAAEHWRVAPTIDADAAWARSALAVALVRLGRPGDADALLLERQRSHPADIACFIAYARLPEERRDWQAAAERWRVVMRDFPDHPDGCEGLLRTLRKAGHPAEAGAILTEGLQRFPTSEWIMLEAAHLARHLGKIDEALQVLQLVRLHFPRLLPAYTAAAGILRDAARYDEAQALLTVAMTLFPDHWMVWREVGLLIQARDGWAGAVAHWAEMGRRLPDAGDQSVRMHEALLRLAEIDPAATDIAARSFGHASPDDVLRTLALSFESLGGCGPAGGCEFGFVQRACNAEPLGLLRWAFMAPDRLITCLGNRFEGIGSPETTELHVEKNDPDSLWDVRDTRGGITMHTFVPVQEVPYQRMAILAQKRMAYLKEKLIADLENPTKIFVLKAVDRHLTETELEDLGQGIRSYGPGQLLCVFASDSEHPPGHLETCTPGVQVGYLDFASGNEYQSRTPAWLALCRKVLAGTRP
jgi:tetratricopeptide (TPR) repeat protein